MKYVIGGRGSGKTTKMIVVSEITGYPIVVSTERQKEHIKAVAERLKCKIPNPMVVKEAIQRGTRLCTPILIDNAEEIINQALKSYFGTDVFCLTMTIESENNFAQEKEGYM